MLQKWLSFELRQRRKPLLYPASQGSAAGPTCFPERGERYDAGVLTGCGRVGWWNWACCVVGALPWSSVCVALRRKGDPVVAASTQHSDIERQ